MILPLSMGSDKSHHHSRLEKLLFADPLRMEILELVEQVLPGEGWVGGGFVRNLVWDNLGDRNFHLNDIDVIFLGGEHTEASVEDELRIRAPQHKWSVKDQMLMASRHGHTPYRSIEEALSYWVEKCTAVAVRLNNGHILIEAPYGLNELFAGVISPSSDKLLPLMRDRIENKRWLLHYPFLVVQSE